MKKSSYSRWTKLVSFVVCVAMGITCLFFGIASIMGLLLSNGEASSFENRLIKNYLAEVVTDSAGDMPSTDLLSQLNLEYAIYKGKTNAADSLNNDVANSGGFELGKETVKVYYSKGYEYSYCTSSLAGALMARNTSFDGSEYVSTPCKNIVLDPVNGLFYLLDENGNYYKLDEVIVNTQDRSMLYSLSEDDEGNYIYTGDETLDISKYETWISIVVPDADKQYLISELEFATPEKDQIESGYAYIYMGEDALMIEHTAKAEEFSGYTIYAYVNKDYPKHDLLSEYAKWTKYLMDNLFVNILLAIMSFLLGIAALVYSMSAAGHRKNAPDEITLTLFDKIPWIVQTGAVIVIELGLIYGCSLLFQCSASTHMSDVQNLILTGVLAGLGIALAQWYMMSFAVRIKSKKFMHYTLAYILFYPLIKLGSVIQKGRSVMAIVLVLQTVLTIVEMIVISATGYQPGREILLFLIYKIFEYVFVIFLVNQLIRLYDGSQHVANGDYKTNIDTKWMFPRLKKQAMNINSVSEGINTAVEERMKSERFKTELITNVSHDIKTPLTSIINYVDLMKKEEIENETVKEYMQVIDRQSARLKKLIEDLMEASKASTGNLEVHFEACEVGVMLTQAVGEFEDRASARNLQLVVRTPEIPLYIRADGRHLWRVFDNLLNNICKYSAENTRVYIDVAQQGNQVCIWFKNISKEQLNISSSELLERFVRGDSSRNTEGSGLGLSIAQSLTELMNGKLKLEIDGDLFKAGLFFELSEENIING